ncbi:hypothetical protein [Nocardia iowensis]|uniref:Uncharacterized protein n=1 Tax=Nocardia iowensis TaxID=204891 RepID=A0ABX8RYS6_NOCIO|nr:hypothetical protein [Nocardia iowensis]QXN94693.1 hypothetical protein KV110_17535 [Nocardia iowensis]
MVGIPGKQTGAVEPGQAPIAVAAEEGPLWRPACAAATVIAAIALVLVSDSWAWLLLILGAPVYTPRKHYR